MDDEPESPNQGACLRHILTKAEKSQLIFAERDCRFFCQRSHEAEMAEKSQVL